MGKLAFRNGAFAVKHGSEQKAGPGPVLVDEPRCLRRVAFPRARFSIFRRGSGSRVLDLNVLRSEKERSGICPSPGSSSVRGRRVSANVMPGPRRFPSADLTCVLDRDKAMRRTRPATPRARSWRTITPPVSSRTRRSGWRGPRASGARWRSRCWTRPRGGCGPGALRGSRSRSPASGSAPDRSRAAHRRRKCSRRRGARRRTGRTGRTTSASRPSRG